jgi:hypothetical protein
LRPSLATVAARIGVAAARRRARRRGPDADRHPERRLRLRQPGQPRRSPAEAARAAAQLEYLASEIPSGARWREFDPTVGLALRGARQEARAALGIAPQAPPQAVVDALFATSRALGAGDHTAAQRLLAPPAFPNGPQTLQRLSGLPPLPAANRATSRAAAELDRVDRIGGGGGGDGGGGGHS